MSRHKEASNRHTVTDDGSTHPVRKDSASRSHRGRSQLAVQSEISLPFNSSGEIGRKSILNGSSQILLLLKTESTPSLSSSISFGPTEPKNEIDQNVIQESKPNLSVSLVKQSIISNRESTLSSQSSLTAPLGSRGRKTHVTRRTALKQGLLTRQATREQFRPLGPQHLEYAYTLAHRHFKQTLYCALGTLGYCPPTGTSRTSTKSGLPRAEALSKLGLAPDVIQRLKDLPALKKASDRLNKADCDLEEALSLGQTWENTPLPDGYSLHFMEAEIIGLGWEMLNGTTEFQFVGGAEDRELRQPQEWNEDALKAQPEPILTRTRSQSATEKINMGDILDNSDSVSSMVDDSSMDVRRNDLPEATLSPVSPKSGKRAMDDASENSKIFCKSGSLRSTRSRTCTVATCLGTGDGEGIEAVRSDVSHLCRVGNEVAKGKRKRIEALTDNSASQTLQDGISTAMSTKGMRSGSSDQKAERDLEVRMNTKKIKEDPPHEKKNLVAPRRNPQRSKDTRKRK